MGGVEQKLAVQQEVEWAEVVQGANSPSSNERAFPAHERQTVHFMSEKCDGLW